VPSKIRVRFRVNSLLSESTGKWAKACASKSVLPNVADQRYLRHRLAGGFGKYGRSFVNKKTFG